MAHQVFAHFSPARHGNNTGHHYNTGSNSRNPASPLVNPNSTLPPGDPIPASKSRRRSRGGRKHRKHPRQETDAFVRMTPLSLAGPSPAQRIASAFCEDPPSRLPSAELPTFQMDANLYAPLGNLSKATPLVGLKKKLSTTSASGDEVMPDLLNESKTAATASPFSNVPVQALPSFNALFNESNPYWDVMGLKNAKPSPFAGFPLSDKEMEENVNAALRANNAATATTKVGPASSSAKSASIEDKIASTSVGKTKPTGYGNTKTTSAAITNEAKTTADKDVDTGVGRFVLTTGGASPKTTADGSNDESPPTKAKSATASATLTPEEMEELMAKVTAAAHHAATAALYEYTTGVRRG